MPFRANTASLAVIGGLGIAAVAASFAGMAPKTKREEQFRTVHGTGKATQNGFTRENEGLDSLEVRKAVQGKSPKDKY